MQIKRSVLKMSKKIYTINIFCVGEGEWGGPFCSLEKTISCSLKEDSIEYKKEVIEKLANEEIEKYAWSRDNEYSTDFKHDEKTGACSYEISLMYGDDAGCGYRAEITPCEVVEL